MSQSENQDNNPFEMSWIKNEKTSTENKYRHFKKNCFVKTRQTVDLISVNKNLKNTSFTHRFVVKTKLNGRKFFVTNFFFYHFLVFPFETIIFRLFEKFYERNEQMQLRKYIEKGQCNIKCIMENLKEKNLLSIFLN